MATYNNRSSIVMRWVLTLCRCSLIGASGLLLLLTAPAMARGEAVRFDIAAQPLPAALKVFAAQAQMQLLYEQSAVAGASANAVIGEFDKQVALMQLLRNTGLQIVYSSTDAATIRPMEKQSEGRRTDDVRASDQLRLVQIGPPAASGDSSHDSAKTALEEVVVTARRREENVQEVPVSITVVSQQTLQDNNVYTFSDLQALVPSMAVTTSFIGRDRLSISIRGQGTNGISGLPGVVTYVNEVPIPPDQGGRSAGGPGLMFDLENLQVLKGPQGTLFGRNTTGGAILLQSKRPTNEFGGRIQVGAGNYNDREVDAALDVPLVDEKLLTRIAFNGQKRDGFTHLLGEPGHPNGIDADNRHFWSVRGTLTFRPTHWFENEAIATYTEYDSHGYPWILSDLNPNGFATFVFQDLPGQLAQQQALGIRNAIPVDTHLESSGSYLTLANISRFALTDTFTLRNVFGYSVSKEVVQLDLDATSLPIFNIPSTPRVQFIRQITEEPQLLGKSLDGRLDWIFGGFYLRTLAPDAYVVQTATVFGSPSDATYRQGDTSKAVFAQGTYDLSTLLTGLKFTAGARYTRDDRFYNDRGGGTSVCAGPTVNCPPRAARKIESSATTWTIGVDYTVRPGTLLYVTSRRGYRAGGSNVGLVNGQSLPFDPEYVTDVEVGTKTDWRIGQVPVRTNVAIYYEKYRDIQVGQSVPNPTDPSGQTVVTANAAAAKLSGAEVEMLAELTDRLQVGANFQYFNFKYDDFGPRVDAAQLEANRYTERPPRKYGASARYRLPLAPEAGDLSVQVNWNWRAHSGDATQPGGVIDAYALLNAAINWDRIAGTPIDLSLFGSNLTNKVYVGGVLGLYNTVGMAEKSYGEPRMYGARLRYRFGAQGAQ